MPTSMSTKQVIDGYTRAWTSADFVATRTFLADDLDFQGSLQTHVSADGFLEGLKMFREHVFDSHAVLHEVITGNEGFVLYDCALKSGAKLRCAEHFIVAGDKIKQIRLVFDTAQMPTQP